VRSPDQIGITWEENQSLMMQLKEKQALENRRKNNIFEVGDKVVLKNSYQDNVLTVQEFRDGFIRAFLGDSIKYSFGHAANFRHAEPEELEAGKRLEVV